jgi:hypothetical protein
VTLDPAIRRRFVYFMLHEQDKLKPKEWGDATVWGEEVLPLLWWKILQMGFSKIGFKNAYLKARDSLITENDKGEEATLYGALGAVFGEEILDEALEVNLKGAQIRPLQELGRESITSQFFNFVNTHMGKLFKGRNFQSGYTKAEILTIAGGFRSTNETKVVLQKLISIAWRMGFYKITTLSEKAVEKAIISELNGKKKTIKIDGVVYRGVIFEYLRIDKKHPFQMFIVNLQGALKDAGNYLFGLDKESLLEENTDTTDIDLETNV